MKIQLLSDLHLESRPFTLKPSPQADVIALAGDIAVMVNPHSMARFRSILRDIGDRPVVYCQGNHEPYGSSRFYSTGQVKGLTAAFPRFHILDESWVDIGGYRFVGGTLYSDFTLPAPWASGQGPYSDPELAMEVALNGISDFRVVRDMNPGFMVEAWTRTRGVIKLAAQGPLPVVAMTHFLPSAKSISPQYASSTLNPYFASNCEDLMGGNVKAWLHGHTHSSADYWHEGTHVVCNPRGYTAKENPEFSSQKLIDLSTQP